jgi:lysophospholipase L1-like esterase
MENNRRSFIFNSLTGMASLLAIPQIVAEGMPSENSKRHSILNSLKKDDVILFQGDSITDAGRDKNKQLSNSAGSFGTGYAFIAASKILNLRATDNLMIYNRGISGNKVYQLAERWDKDCIELNPGLISILIGVNDFWHHLNGKYDGTVETYENDYRKLLAQTTKIFPDAHLIIGEPFAVLGGSTVNEKWYPAFDAYRHVAKTLANEFNATLIPYQTIFDEAKKYAPASYWTADGVHPTMAGSSLMAEAWLKAVM